MSPRTGPPVRPPTPDDLADRTSWPAVWDDYLRVRGLQLHTWAGYAHGLAAYRLYMQDRLPEALAAADEAFKQGTYANSGWLASIMYEAGAELEARDNARRVERPPFIFELPAEHARYDHLIDLADKCAARVERMLAFERPATMFTLLPRGSLIRHTDSRYGYMVPKEPYFKVCVPQPAPRDVEDVSATLIHEYVHVAVHALSGWQAPRWLNEGLAQWMEDELLGRSPDEEPLMPPGEFPHLAEVSGLFDATGEFHHMDPHDYAYDAALAAVRELVAWHGEGDVREFVVRLAKESEGRAFRSAFGQSQRQFEREWHERLRHR